VHRQARAGKIPYLAYAPADALKAVRARAKLRHFHSPAAMTLVNSPAAAWR